MSEQPRPAHESPYDFRTDIIRTDYVGRHRAPEQVVDIADQRRKRRQKKQGGQQ